PPVIEKALSARHLLNLMLPNPLDAQSQRAQQMKNHRCNIRHGEWKASRSSAAPQAWSRPVKMVIAVCFLWLFITWGQNIQLERTYTAQQDAMIEILHTALPGEPNIDILAQLKRATHDAGAGTGQGVFDVALQLQHISEVFAQHAWQMQEIKVDKNGVLMSGKVKDLTTLNTIRDLLADKITNDVNIADTDLSGDEVSFRMRW
ncbi:MAG: hypothetical protein Q9M19_07730, partial [Mariprofundaceae bacterium]|nr:hypothetical protein [Mariprofundaceae bacterium]